MTIWRRRYVKDCGARYEMFDNPARFRHYAQQMDIQAVKIRIMPLYNVIRVTAARCPSIKFRGTAGPEST